MTDDSLRLISNRRREIETEIARLSDRIAKLQAELPELQSAERVINRLAQGGGGQASDSPPPAPPSGHEEVAGMKKPAGTPIIPTMIVEALREARKAGVEGLPPAGMTEYIRAKWWPNASGVAISPIAWRMSKRGDLIKDGVLYKLPSRNREAAEPGLTLGSAASEPEPRALRPVEPAPRRGT